MGDQLTDPGRVDDYVDMSFTAAATGRPGPAVLLLPKDVLTEQVPESPAGPPWSSMLGRFPLDRCRPDGAVIRQAAELLAAARQPLVIAGGGIHLSGAAAALSDLQQAASLPVATTTMGKGSVDERHPLSSGVIGSFMGPASPGHHLRGLVASADVILLAGTRTNENGTDAWRLYPPDARYISIDIDGTEVNRTYDAVRLVGDARLALEDLRAELGRHDLSRRAGQASDVIATIAQARAGYAADAQPLLTSEQAPLRPERIMAELDSLLTEDTSWSPTPATRPSGWPATCGPAGPASGSSRRAAWPGSAGDCRWRWERRRPSPTRRSCASPGTAGSAMSGRNWRRQFGNGWPSPSSCSTTPSSASKARRAVQLRRAHIRHRLLPGGPCRHRPGGRRDRPADRLGR